jgi:capsular polysaccharide biosynthesis protein
MTATELETPSRSVFEVLRRRSAVALATFLIVAVASFAFVLVHKVKYGALSHVLLVNDPSGRDPSVAAADMATIVTGSTVLSDVQQKLGLSDSINDLRKTVNARVSPKSSLMTIAVQNHDPKAAIAIDNKLAESFARLYWSLAGTRYDEVTRRLASDVSAARERVSVIERQLENASAGSSYVGSQASLDASAARLGDLQESRGIAVGQLVTDQANLEADREQPGKTAKIVRHEILMNNAKYRETETLVSKDMAQYTTTRAGVTNIFPGIAGFTDKVEKEGQALDVLRDNALTGRDAYSPSLAGQIVQAAKDAAAVAGDRAKLAAIDDQMRALHEKLSSSTSDGTESIGALRAERDTAEAQLQALSLRLSAAQANSAEASSMGQVVIVDRATEARPTLIGPTFLMALGLLAASILAISSAYLAELLIPRLLGPGDVEDVYGRPILASLRAR